ncbi:MAG: hypothetical protein QM711_05060 [Micropruina sp.]|uniref:hypothetical protein n=1 Tax=Micropruina sp. TaxID=2737536 RepID=UPI0039E6F90D
MDLDAAADELYGLDPDAFMPARTALVASARAAKDRPLASAIGALRKPTRSAWLVNLLARDAPDRLRQLDELAGRLAAAHQKLDMTALRELSGERQQLVAALTASAVAAGSDRGYQATEAVRTEVNQTLSAAIADAVSRAEVLAGRVVKAHVYSGFGFALSTGPASVAETTSPAAADGAPPPEIADQRAAALARRRAQEMVDAATAALVEARNALRTAQQVDAEAHAGLDRAAQEVADLRTELRAAEASEMAARQRANEAADQLHEARGAVQRGERALSEAARALGEVD